MMHSGLPPPTDHDTNDELDATIIRAHDGLKGLKGRIEGRYLETGNTTDDSIEYILMSAHYSLQHIRTRFSTLR
jgi:hypothetical protein